MLDLYAHFSFNDETGNRFVRFSLWRCLGVDQKIICSFGSHYKTFLAIQDIMISILLGDGGCSEEVRSSPGFGERLCTAEFPLKGRLQIFSLLLWSAEMVDGFAADAHQGVEAGHP